MKSNKNRIFFLLGFFLASIGFSKNARTIHLNDQKTEPIYIGIQGTVINFPSHPENVVLLPQGSFAVKYIRDDLAISALHPGSQGNLFVYIEGRRFGFNLKGVSNGGDEIVLIRDASQMKMKVKVTYE